MFDLMLARPPDRRRTTFRAEDEKEVEFERLSIKTFWSRGINTREKTTQRRYNETRNTYPCIPVGEGYMVTGSHAQTKEVFETLPGNMHP